MADYIPRPDKEFGPWLDNLNIKVPTVATKYSIPAATVTQLASDTLMWDFILKNYDAADNYAKQFTSFKNTLRKGPIGNVAITFPAPPTFTAITFPAPPTFTAIPPAVFNGIERRIRLLANQIKSNPNYSVGDGEALGIIGDDPVGILSQEDLQPTLKVSLNGGKVLVKWKKGKTDGINIYVKRGDADFVFLAFDGSPDYTDGSALPDASTTWTYRAIYVIKDTEVGQFSDAVSINVRKIV
jgi:hypothetical protein